LANTDKLKGKMKENIEANKEKVSYLKLYNYPTRLSSGFDEKDYELSTQMSKNRCSFFNELEFRRMAEQFDAIFKEEQQPQASLLMMLTQLKNSQKTKISLIF
jgi:DNA polymerase-1